MIINPEMLRTKETILPPQMFPLLTCNTLTSIQILTFPADPMLSCCDPLRHCHSYHLCFWHRQLPGDSSCLRQSRFLITHAKPTVLQLLWIKKWSILVNVMYITQEALQSFWMAGLSVSYRQHDLFCTTSKWTFTAGTLSLHRSTDWKWNINTEKSQPVMRFAVLILLFSFSKFKPSFFLSL